MLQLEGERATEIEEFISKAVALPFEELMVIQRHLLTTRVHHHRVTVTMLAKSDERVRQQCELLREYIKIVATENAYANGNMRFMLSVNWLAAAIFPAAQALLMRDRLENGEDESHREAFRTLTEPFGGLVS